MNEVTQVNLKETKSGHKMIAVDQDFQDTLAPEFKANFNRIPSRYRDESELIAYDYLQKSAEILKLSRNLFASEQEKARIDYIIYLADSALDNKEK